MRKFIFAFVIVMVSFTTSVFAEGRNSVSFGAGGAWPEGMDGTWYFTAATRWHLDDNWAIEPDFGYWKQDEAQITRTNRGDIIRSLSDLHIGGNFLLVGSWGNVGMFGGGGAAAHFRKTEVEQNVNPPRNLEEFEETRLGLQTTFGIDIPLAQKMDFSAGVRNDWIFRDEEEGGIQLVFKAWGGLRIYFN